jgi:hypothetical protein
MLKDFYLTPGNWVERYAVHLAQHTADLLGSATVLGGAWPADHGHGPAHRLQQQLTARGRALVRSARSQPLPSCDWRLATAAWTAMRSSLRYSRMMSACTGQPFEDHLTAEGGGDVEGAELTMDDGGTTTVADGDDGSCSNRTCMTERMGDTRHID